MQTLNTFESANQARMIKLAMNEHPYGDPFSGAPYGQFEKSKGLGMVLGVVTSVVSMGAALPMLASANLATQLAGGAMMAGGVLNGVGTVTGNKKLMKIGGVLGRVNTALILGLAYLFIFIPLGLLLRLFGKDTLKKRWREDVTTYRRVKPPRPASHMERQF